MMAPSPTLHRPPLSITVLAPMILFHIQEEIGLTSDWGLVRRHNYLANKAKLKASKSQKSILLFTLEAPIIAFQLSQ